MTSETTSRPARGNRSAWRRQTASRAGDSARASCSSPLGNLAGSRKHRRKLHSAGAETVDLVVPEGAIYEIGDFLWREEASLSFSATFDGHTVELAPPTGLSTPPTRTPTEPPAVGDKTLAVGTYFVDFIGSHFANWDAATPFGRPLASLAPPFRAGLADEADGTGAGIG
ncbi:MAG: hypothetical protein HY901_12515 [Deltaproteobacteria bacterium]|nr:hypothetical protein [Deltaproteobacteria bacterium]